MNKQNIALGLVLIFVLSLSACAPIGFAPTKSGFFAGLLHGFVFFFALIGKLFSANVALYAENNTGFFYWLGFIIGLTSLGGGASQSRRR